MLWIWLITLVLSAVAITRVPFLTDMSVFLPRHPTAQQALLVQGINSGASAQGLLVAVSGAPVGRRAELSRQLAQHWQSDPQVRAVLNGQNGSFRLDEKLIFEARYLLSPTVNEESFSVAALRAAMQSSIRLLSTSMGLFGKQHILRDPTGEFVHAIQAMTPRDTVQSEGGVWVNQDHTQLLFLIQSTVSGGDLDSQERLLERIRTAFSVVRAHADLNQIDMVISGAATFAVESRRSIRDDVTRLSAIGAGLIVLLLLIVFRSPWALMLTLMPMVSAVVVGAAAVALTFGSLHGLTLGFGAALIGETVDYAIYHLAGVAREPGATARSSQPRFWPTIGLGVVTSFVGFSALLWSGFPGLAQLAVFSMAGLTAGFLVARRVLPALTPMAFNPRSLVSAGRTLHGVLSKLRRARGALLLASCVATAFCVTQRDRLWDKDIASLNPITQSAQALDTTLRSALGEQGSRVIVLVQSNGDEDTLLEATFQVSLALDMMVKDGKLAGFSSPTMVLPPPSIQVTRQRALPDVATLTARLDLASQGLPIGADSLKYFVSDVQASRTRVPLRRTDLIGTQLATQLEPLLIRQGEQRTAILPVRERHESPVSVEQIARALPRLPGATIKVLDLTAQTNSLYAGYLGEAIMLSAFGGLAIAALLWLRLGTVAKAMRVSIPVLGALVFVVAGLALAGKPMNLLHLVGLLLVVAIGSNYALLLADYVVDRFQDPTILASLALANMTTLLGYGVLAASSVPLLSALGTTVGLGAPLVLLLSAAWMGDNGR